MEARDAAQPHLGWPVFPRTTIKALAFATRREGSHRPLRYLSIAALTANRYRHGSSKTGSLHLAQNGMGFRDLPPPGRVNVDPRPAEPFYLADRRAGGSAVESSCIMRRAASPRPISLPFGRLKK